MFQSKQELQWKCDDTHAVNTEWTFENQSDTNDNIFQLMSWMCGA